MPRAEHAHHKTKEDAAEETCGSGSEEDRSDSDDEGIDGYKKGETPLLSKSLNLSRAVAIFQQQAIVVSPVKLL